MNSETLSGLKVFNTLRKNPSLGFVRKLLPTKLKNYISRMYGISTEGEAPLHSITLESGTTVRLPMDQYWAYYMDDINAYEPEMKKVINSFAGENTLFVDGGANVGLWSVYAAGIINNKDQVIAVEPTESTLKILRENSAINDNNFSIVPKAIWNKSGEILEFKLYHSHAANSLKDNSEADGSEREVKGVLKIETISVGDIIKNAKELRPNIDSIILKLDVEGVEIEALDGMKEALANDNILIIYEDHGKESESKTTDHILNKLGMNVYYISEEKTSEALQITDLSQLAKIKRNKSKGYNFMTCTQNTAFDKEMQAMCVSNHKAL